MVAQVTAKLLPVLLAVAGGLHGQARQQEVGNDPREIVRKSVELDQANWARMKDYTWIARETDRSLDSRGQVKSEKTDEWETVVLYGEAHHRMLQRDGKTLSADDQRTKTPASASTARRASS
jgi:hypothetical protein